MKAAVEILDQILRVFETDMEPESGAIRSPAGRAPAAFGLGRQDQALIAAPAGADAEQVEFVYQRIDRCFGRGVEHDTEQSAGAEKVAFPEPVAGVLRQGRVEHAR